jgi:hypothetical protein
MEQDEEIKVRIVRFESASFVESVIVLYERRNLHVMCHALDHRAKGVRRGSVGQGELRFAVHHGLGADEDDVECGQWEHVRKLVPDFARKRRLRTRTEDEEADWRWGYSDAFHVFPSAGTRGMEGVTES